MSYNAKSNKGSNKAFFLRTSYAYVIKLDFGLMPFNRKKEKAICCSKLQFRDEYALLCGVVGSKNVK